MMSECRFVPAYINAIAPKDKLLLGSINKIGVNEPGVDYFSIVSWSLNGISQAGTEVIQGIDSKMILDRIEWIEE